jgi:hypothetical protein
MDEYKIPYATLVRLLVLELYNSPEYNVDNGTGKKYTIEYIHSIVNGLDSPVIIGWLNDLGVKVYYPWESL